MLDYLRYRWDVRSVSWCVSVFALGWGVAFAAARLDADEAVGSGSDASGPEFPVELTLAERLEIKISLDVVDVPLRRVVEQLSEQSGLDFQIDQRALDEMGLSDEDPISVRFADVPLRSALKIVLHEMALDWIVRRHVILVTTEEMAEKYLTPRVYPVTDLVYSQNEFGKSQVDLDSLRDLIQSVIVPECWIDLGGPSTIEIVERDGKFLLVVRCTELVRDKIELLLAGLRRIGGLGSAELAQEPGRWQLRDERVAKQMARCLDIDLTNLTISEFAEQIEQEIGIPLIVDTRALDEMGLSSEGILNPVETRPVGGGESSNSLERSTGDPFRDDPFGGGKPSERLNDDPFANPRSDDPFNSSVSIFGDPNIPVAYYRGGGVRFDPPLKDMPIGMALSWILGELELTWAPDDDFIWITTEEAVEEYGAIVRLHDVSDVMAIRELEDTIQQMVKPESWLDNGGPGSMEAIRVNGRTVLAVRQGWDVQCELEQLLADLRAEFDGEPSPPEDAVSLMPESRVLGPGGEIAPQVAVSIRPRISSELELDVSANFIAQTIRGSNRFGMSLYDRLLDEGPVGVPDERNLLYSPYSLANAVGMVYVGARSETAEQIADVMGFPGEPEEQAKVLAAIGQRIEVSRLVRRNRMIPYPWSGGFPGSFSLGMDGGRMVPDGVLAQFDGMGCASGYMQRTTYMAPCPVQMGNAIWCSPEFAFEPSYVEDLERCFGGDASELDFSDSESACSVINDWIGEQTNGRIDGAVSPRVLGDDASMVLVDTAYFDSEWSVPFGLNNTRNGPFFGLDARQAQLVPLMMEQGYCGYAWVDGVQVVEKACQDRDFSMLFMLPTPGEEAWRLFESDLDATFVDRAADALKTHYMRLYVPRFELDGSYELSDAFQKLGMPLAFGSANADFSGMASSPETGCLQKVVHRAVLRVEESESVAWVPEDFPAGIGRGFGYDPHPMVVRLDRPFVLVVRHKPSGAILFVGRVMRPVASEG